jgi:hypothetical protein
MSAYELEEIVRASQLDTAGDAAKLVGYNLTNFAIASLEMNCLKSHLQAWTKPTIGPYAIGISLLTEGSRLRTVSQLDVVSS